jgi:hypothetical protein
MCVIKCSRIIWEGHLAYSGGKRNTCKVLVGRPLIEEKLGKPLRQCEESIKIDLKVVGWDGVDWNNPTQYMEMWRHLLPKIISFLFHKMREIF